MIMYKAALILALALSGPVYADLIASNGMDWVRISGRPCENQAVLAIANTREPAHQKMFAASSTVAGQEYKGCWVLRGRSDIHIIYEDGDEGLIPVEDFRKELDS